MNTQEMVQALNEEILLMKDELHQARQKKTFLVTEIKTQ